MGNIQAFMTASAIRYHGDGSEDYSERHGWIDQDWSMTQLHDNRNDVRSLMNTDERDRDELAGDVRDILGDGSLWADNGDGTYISQVDREENGITYSYCVHFKRKFLGPDGWTETAWHPERDGGISLSE